jgi:hypothetical protein
MKMMNTKSFITPFEGHRPVIAGDAFVDVSAWKPEPNFIEGKQLTDKID